MDRDFKVRDLTVWRDIERELTRARAKFPGTTDIPLALMEEVGELAQALIQQKHEPKKTVTDAQIYDEAVQVAAMAIRIAREGVPSFPYNPEEGYFSVR